MPNKAPVTTKKHESSARFEKLVNEGERLDEEKCMEIASNADDTLVPELLKLLSDETLALVDAPGEGIVPINAVRVLRQLKPAEAIAPMLEALSRSKYSDMIYSDIIFSLQEFGAPALEPALKAHQDCVEAGKEAQAQIQTGIAEILSGIGVKDQRIFSILLDMLNDDAETAASLLTKYGDPAALPHLSAALDETPASDRAQIIELAAAINGLGGTLTKRQQKLWERKIAKDKSKTNLSSHSDKATIFRLPKPGVRIKF